MLAHQRRPAVLAVVDGDVGAEGAQVFDLPRAPRQPGDGGAHVAGGLDEQAPEAARRGRDHDDVVGGDGGQVEHGDRCPAGADQCHGARGVEPGGDLVQRRLGGDRVLGVAPAGHPQVSDDASPHPRRNDICTDRVDGAGHLPTRRHRQGRQRERTALVTTADRRVHEMDARRLDRDAHLVRTRVQVGNVLDLQDVGRTELVLADRRA